MKSPSKQNLILRSLFIAGGLTLFKLAVFFVTNSIAIMASALDSLMDLVVSLMNFIFMRSASAPADQNHPYGHGKIESLAALIQSLLIGGAVFGVGWGAVHRFSSPQGIQQPQIGIVVMLVALILNIWHVKNLKKSKQETLSQIMATEYLHYMSDTYIYIGVLLAFVLTQFTQQTFWDPLISLLIVGYLVKGIVELFVGALTELLDMQLPDDILKEIDSAIRNFHPAVVDYHDLRTRKVGSTKFIEFHMVLRGIEKFHEAHDLTEGVIRKLRKMYPGAIVTVHTDPEGVMEPDED